MPIRFTNTLTGRKEDFHPLKPGRVTLYVCGVTVYDDCHIGHARGAVVFDVLRRFLESSGLKVRHVRNITDVDDKIIARAQQGGQTPGGLTPSGLKEATQAVASFYTERFQRDFSLLGLLPPHEEPKATEFIPKMVAFIGDLIARGMAYPASDGVYFSVRKLEGYGRLSHQNPDQMMDNAHVDAGQGKKDPLDFALWKKAKPEEPSWPSPWGEGRPGWHVECTAMSAGLLGDAFDIHGGGQDLVFPHHENELAQATGAGKPFARTWLHNGLLTVNGQKMSKSLGNFVTIEEALKRHPAADVLRLFFLSAHYRSPQDFTWEHLDEAAHAYERWATFLSHADALGPAQPVDLKTAKGQEGFEKAFSSYSDGFHQEMSDDLNTPQARASLDLLVSLGHIYIKTVPVRGNNPRHSCARLIRDRVRELGRIMGFFQLTDSAVSFEADELSKKRDEARKRGDFATADWFRKQLIEMGYVVEDTAGGTVVRRRI